MNESTNAVTTSIYPKAISIFACYIDRSRVDELLQDGLCVNCLRASRIAG